MRTFLMVLLADVLIRVGRRFYDWGLKMLGTGYFLVGRYESPDQLVARLTNLAATLEQPSPQAPTATLLFMQPQPPGEKQ